ncbi:MAG: EF-P 5-aminopentanol modification-associated protein YfmF [Clostridia bacterium]
MGEIISKQIKQGINMHYVEDKKFNAIVIKTFFVRELDEDTTKASLLSKVMKRGTDKFTKSIELKKAFEANYGTVFTIKVKKIGEKHLFEVTLFMPDKKIIGEGEGSRAFKKNLDLLTELVFNPLKENGKLSQKYVNQEKKALSDEIQAIYNDKQQWALRRCIEVSCKDEPYSMPSKGKLEDLDAIGSFELTNFYKKMLNDSPIEFYIAGDVSSKDLTMVVDEFLDKFESRQQLKYSSSSFNKESLGTKYFEYDDINQGKLVISMRTNVDPCSSQLPAYVLFNAIFGGGTYSKLFKIVREENSLAYYMHSVSDRNKMISIIEAGINEKDYDKTVSLIEKILDDIKAGDILQEELDQARDAIINTLWSLEDFAGGNINHHIIGVLSGCPITTEEFKSRLRDVSLNQIHEVSKKVSIDTIYFLSSRNGGGRVE